MKAKSMFKSSLLTVCAVVLGGCVTQPRYQQAYVPAAPAPVVMQPVEQAVEPPAGQPYRQGLDEVYQVTVAVQGVNSMALLESLENEAKKQAIVKYMRRHDAFQDGRILQEAANEYGRFVLRYRALETPVFTALSGNGGQLKGTFQIELNVASINRWLQTKGVSNQAGIALMIMEEPPSLGQMKIYGELQNYMVTNYTMMQRVVRDAILKQVAEYGFDVQLLEDNPAYAAYKDKDHGLMGTYFDVAQNSFAIHYDLLDAIRGNNPEAFVLMYRIDALIWDQVANDVRATVSVNVKNLRNNVTRHFGRAVLQFPTSSNDNLEKAFDDLSHCVSSTVCSLFNSEEAGRKLNEMVMGMKNQQFQPANPIRLVINANTFAPAIRQRAIYTLKRELANAGILASQPVSNNFSMTAIINPAKYTDPQGFVYDCLLPLIKRHLDVNVTDQQIVFEGTNVTIKH